MQEFETPESVLKISNDLESLTANALSTQELAEKVVDYLYSKLLSDERGKACALVRFFRTVTYDALKPELQELVEQKGKRSEPRRMNYLTLLATRGDEPDWNSPETSKAHRCIALGSLDSIAHAPMIAQLVKNLGINAASVVNPDLGIFKDPREKKYSSFFVERALDSPHIPGQAEFVVPYKIQSFVGLGGLLPTGDMFALLLVFKVPVSAAFVDQLSTLTATLEKAINKIRSGKKKNAKILIADTIGGVNQISRLLEDRHQVMVATTMEQAQKTMIKSDFDMIICDTKFDDSRMFELLKTVKKDPAGKSKPFICLRPMLFGNDLSAAIYEGVANAASLLGARYIDGSKTSNDDLVLAIESYLPERIWV